MTVSVVAVCSLIRHHVEANLMSPDTRRTTSCNLNIANYSTLCGSHRNVLIADDRQLHTHCERV